MRAFVIAMDCEVAAIRGLTREEDQIFVCGIGKVNAAMATQKAIDAGADEIINVGLCGGFGKDVRVGGVYEVKAAVEYDFDLADLNGTRIGQLDEKDSPFFTAETTGKFPAKILATGDRFNDCEDDFQTITEDLGAELRDMEGAAIAHVCEYNRVRFRSLKCVSDIAGDELMTKQYLDNREKAVECLRSAVISWI